MTIKFKIGSNSSIQVNLLFVFRLAKNPTKPKKPQLIPFCLKFWSDCKSIQIPAVNHFCAQYSSHHTDNSWKRHHAKNFPRLTVFFGVWIFSRIKGSIKLKVYIVISYKVLHIKTEALDFTWDIHHGRHYSKCWNKKKIKMPMCFQTILEKFLSCYH